MAVAADPDGEQRWAQAQAVVAGGVVPLAIAAGLSPSSSRTATPGL